MLQQDYIYKNKFFLENGQQLPELKIRYHVAGKINKQKTNVVWICHALTANSNPEEWWPGLVGKNKLYDPENYFIICANIIGSCYGSTGPLCENPSTKKSYFRDFPEITIRDMVNAHELLRKHLGINKIHTLIGGSVGGQQALEWSIFKPNIVENLIFIASGAKSSPWLVAFNESQRMAIETDPSYFEDHPKGGLEGLKTARSIALLSYRNQLTYNATQQDNDDKLQTEQKASTYQRYQGKKLADRFNAYSYHSLSKAIDSNNVGRKRNSVEDALRGIKAKTLLIGIDTDILFPANEIAAIESHIPRAIYKEVNSLYGHDGFLLENQQISETISNFYKNGK